MKTQKAHNLRLVITGGGTGGHLFPGISLAQAMIRAYPECEVLFIGTERKVDRTTLADLGFATKTISSQGIKGNPHCKNKGNLAEACGTFQSCGDYQKI